LDLATREVGSNNKLQITVSVRVEEKYPKINNKTGCERREEERETVGGGDEEEERKSETRGVEI
jgi:hypothetical protein